MPADLVEFLRARIEEDAQTHQPSADPWDQWHTAMCGGGIAHKDRGCTCSVPARVLAEVAAKRAIIDACEAAAERASGLLDIDVLGARISNELFGQAILRHLAVPFASHPDYDPAWNTATQDAL